MSAFRAEEYVPNCLANLARQSVIRDCEVIFVNCGASDEARLSAQASRSNFGSFVYLETPYEALYQSWNRALSRARGRFFVNANVDDALAPEALQILTKVMEDHPDAALAYGDWMWATVPNADYPWDCSFRRCIHTDYHPTMPLFYAYAGCHQFWRTDKLRELGGFNASYTAAGDYDALCRMALKRWRAVYVPEAVSAFYQNPNGLSRSSGTSHREFLEIRDRFRNQIAIDDLYHVDPADAAACARAWVDLGHRALSLFVPWAEQATPDFEFAAACARRALNLDSSNRAARQLLTSSGHRPSKLWARLRGLVAGTDSSVSQSKA